MSSSHIVISESPSIARTSASSSPGCHGRSATTPSVNGSTGGCVSTALADGGDDLGREAREAGEEVGALGLQPRDVIEILGESARAVVQAPRLQHFDVVDPRNGRGDEITEVRVALPLDRTFGDPLDDRGRMLDAD